MSSASPSRWSVPASRADAPRPLTARERDVAATLADALCWTDKANVPRPSECAQFGQLLEVAVAARRDVFDDVTEALSAATDVTDTTSWLRSLAETRPDVFTSLSTVLAGAYLMVAEVRSAVGYPGQGRHPAPPSQIGDELAGGILDPVIERGPIYRTP